MSLPSMEGGGVIDHVDEAGGEVVYTTSTGRQVRRRRSIDAEEVVYLDHEDHGLISIKDIRVKSDETSELFDKVMDRIVTDLQLSPNKKIKMKNLEEEMDAMLEKLSRNLKQMEKDDAMYQEVDRHMRSVEESHLVDLSDEYLR